MERCPSNRNVTLESSAVILVQMVSPGHKPRTQTLPSPCGSGPRPPEEVFCCAAQLLCGFPMPVKERQNARPLASACDQNTVLGYRDPIAVIPVERLGNDHNVLLRFAVIQGVGSIIHRVAKCV